MNIKIKSVQYHRNGCTGKPFHLVEFVQKERGEKARAMAAMIFDENTYSVLEIAKPAERFRGDLYIGPILDQMKRKQIESFGDINL